LHGARASHAPVDIRVPEVCGNHAQEKARACEVCGSRALEGGRARGRSCRLVGVCGPPWRRVSDEQILLEAHECA
jgi:hypothetical protein